MRDWLRDSGEALRRESRIQQWQCAWRHGAWWSGSRAGLGTLG